MKVLVLHSAADTYGSGKILLYSTQALKNHGYKIIVVLPSSGPLIALLEQTADSVIVHTLGIIRKKYFNFSGILNRIKSYLKAKKFLSDLIQREKIDVIYSNTTAIWIGVHLAKKFQLKHVWHIHEIIERPKWLAKTIAHFLNYANSTNIAVSEAVRNAWSELGVRKIKRVYNGIDYTPFITTTEESFRSEWGFNQEDIVIGMIGRVHHWKGQDYFIKIAAILKKEFPRLKFVMVGDAFPGNEYLYEELKQLKLQLQMQDHIVDAGYLSNIPKVLQSIDYFILPSQQPDPFPTVILEAMAAQKVVIATAQGGALEMIEDGVSGKHIPINNPAASAQIISDLLRNPSHKLEIGMQAKNRVLSLFSLVSFEANFIQAFHE